MLKLQPQNGAAAAAGWAVPLGLFGIGLITLLLSQGFVRENAQRSLLITAISVLGVVAALWLVRILAFVWAILSRLKGEGPAARLRNKQFGFIFQFYHLLPELNVVE